MASTSNNNTPGNYCLQQRQFSLARDYKLYKNSSNGVPYTPKMPTFGIIPSHMSRDTLSYNPIDIESSLFGINSTNLVKPESPLCPSFKTIQEFDVFDRLPIIMPLPLVIENGQRPLPLP